MSIPAIANAIARRWAVAFKRHVSDDPVKSLPLLFNDGELGCRTLYMNVKRNTSRCVACELPPSDACGTLFACCGCVVCSRCTNEACADKAERIRVDVLDLVKSGRILEGVACPACRVRGGVGFPINQLFGKCTPAADSCVFDDSVLMVV